jgi:TonB family protein
VVASTKAPFATPAADPAMRVAPPTMCGLIIAVAAVMSASRELSAQAAPRCDPDSVPVTDTIRFSVPPRLLNGPEARRRLATAYPDHLRRAGVTGVAWIWVLVLEDGRNASVRLAETSGNAELDSAALNVAGALTFAAPYAGATRVCGWFRIPVRFTVPGGP